MWNPVIRYLFMRIQGRMSNIEAPVVPITLAITPPTNRKSTFKRGVDSPFTVMCTPPATTKSDPIRAMKLRYSCPTCTSRSGVWLTKM